jgi:hypothetical protein
MQCNASNEKAFAFVVPALTKSVPLLGTLYFTCNDLVLLLPDHKIM